LTVNPADTELELVWIVEIEPARRLEEAAWVQAPDPNLACYWISHPEGKPPRVRECLKSTGIIVTYTPDVADLAACQATVSSWYWDATNSRLYVHTSTGADPGGGLFLVNSYFWERLANRDIVLDGHSYKPLLGKGAISDMTFEVKAFCKGGMTESFGNLTVLNGNGYWDARLAAYVYEGKKVLVKYGKPTDLYADFKKTFEGYTGNTTSTDRSAVLASEDPAKFQE
jgi:hypothetical protein